MRMPTIRLPAALGAAWAVLVVANYAPGHLPGVDPYLRLVGAPLLSLTWGQVGHVIARAGAAAALLLLQLAAAAWTGSRILRWIGGAPDRRDGVIFAPLLGLGVIGTIPLGAGLCGLYGAGLYAFLLGIPAVLALRNRSGLRGVAAAWRTAAAARPEAEAKP